MKKYLIPILILLSISSCFAWWDNDWNLRKQINITETSGSDLTNFQVRLVIDSLSLINDNKLESDCSDLRIADSGNSLLNFWIESGCNTASTIIWVKITSLTASSTDSIYMYYNNSGASSQSSITNVMDGEVGSVSVGSSGTTVNLLRSYINPVVIATWHETVGTQEASSRITSKSSNSFDIKLQNPGDNTISSQTVYYMVLEEGLLEFIDDTKVEAYTYTEASVQGSGTVSNWTTHSLVHSYASAPVVFAQVQTNTDSLWTTDHPYSITTTQFQNALEMGQLCSTAVCSGHGAETMGYVVIESGKSSTIGGIDYLTATTGDSVEGHDNGCDTYSFSSSFSSTPEVAFTDLRLRDGSDGGWNVICSLSSTQIGVHCEEEDESDGERSHTTEDASYAAFSNTGILAVKKYATSEPTSNVGDEEVLTICGANGCEAGEDYSNCPSDCCESDCTDAGDSIYHIECDGFDGCSGFISACDDESVGYLSCYNATYTLTCPSTISVCSEGFCNNGACSNCSSVCDGSCSGGIPCYGVDPDCDSSGNATEACCGNGACEGSAGESCSNCEADCGVCPTVEVCSPATCYGECDTCKENTCVGNQCVCQYISNCCGNAICEPPNETFASCHVDCKAPSSISISFIDPDYNQIFTRGDELVIKVNITYDAGTIGINANVTAITPMGTITLYDDGDHDDGSALDGVYANSIIISPDSGTGSQAIEVSAQRGVTGSASRVIQIINELNIVLSTDKGEYVKNELIKLSGSVTDALGRFINATINLDLSHDGILIDTISAEVINGFFNTSYRTTVLDPEGEWTITARIIDQYNNSGSTYKSLTITSPAEGAYYTIDIISPLKGIIKRGRALTITADVTLGETLITNAEVVAKLPSGDYLSLIEVSDGTYSQEYTVPFNDPLGIWYLEIIAEKQSLTGVSVVQLNIEPSDISVEVISPTRSSYSVGEDITVRVEVTYPNGAPVDLPELNINIGDENLTLKSLGKGIYSAMYSVMEDDEDLNINILIEDESNNMGTQDFSISVSGVSPLYYFKEFAYIVYPLIIAGLAGVIFLVLKFARKQSITSLESKRKELKSLKKKAQESYYVEHSIDKERFNELTAKYDSQIKELERDIKELKKKERKRK